MAMWRPVGLLILAVARRTGAVSLKSASAATVSSRTAGADGAQDQEAHVSLLTELSDWLAEARAKGWITGDEETELLGSDGATELAMAGAAALLRGGAGSDNPDLKKGVAALSGIVKGLQKTVLDTHNSTQTQLNEKAKAVVTSCASSSKSLSLKAAFESGAAAHKKCRTEQVTAMASSGGCQQVTEALKQLQNSSCSAPELKQAPDIKLCVPAPGTPTKTLWLKANYEAFEKKYQVYLAMKKQCENSTAQLKTLKCGSAGTGLKAKENECEELLDKVEAAACAWANELRYNCKSYTGCHVEQKNKYEAHVKIVKAQEADLKLQWRMTQRFSCLFNASAAGSVDKSKLDACVKTGVYPTKHLDLVYPTVGNSTKCPPPSIYPGTDAYNATVYTGLPATLTVGQPTACPITTSSTGEFFLIADSGNNRLQKCPLTVKGTCSTVATGFDNPRGILLDSDGSVLVAGSGRRRALRNSSASGRIRRCGADGKCSIPVGSNDEMRPWGVAKTKDGYYLVSDSRKDQVLKCRVKAGKTSWECGRLTGGKGTGKGTYQFYWPYQLAIDKDGGYLVTGYYNHRVQKCSPSPSTEDAQIFKSGSNHTVDCYTVAGGKQGTGPDQLDHPAGVAVDKDGNYVVVDQLNNRVQKCKPIKKGGKPDCFTALGGKEGNGTNQFSSPWGLAMLPDGDYVVSDRGNHRVQKCTPGTATKPGNCTTVAGGAGKGNGAGQLADPRGLALQ